MSQPAHQISVTPRGQQEGLPDPSIDDRLPLAVVTHESYSRELSARHWIWRLILLVALFGTGGILFSFRDPIRDRFLPREPVPKQATPSGPRSVFALGRLEPEGEVVSVAVPNGAGESRVETLNVRESDKVKRGDVLAVLDNEARLNAALQVAMATAEQSRVRIARTQLEVTTTRSQLEAALRSAEAKHANARGSLARLRRLAEANVVSSEELENQELAVTTYDEATKEAQARLMRYESVTKEELVDIALSRQDFSTANASLEQAHANLEQAYVRAPIDGTVLRLHVRAGERIGQTPLLDMGATHRMMARVEVYESDVPRLRIGNPVKLTASPLASPLTGSVEWVMSFVQKQEIVDATPAANTDARIVNVWVRLDAASSVVAANFVNLQVRVEFLP